MSAGFGYHPFFFFLPFYLYDPKIKKKFPILVIIKVHRLHLSNVTEFRKINHLGAFDS